MNDWIRPIVAAMVITASLLGFSIVTEAIVQVVGDPITKEEYLEDKYGPDYKDDHSDDEDHSEDE
jgi:hypothetical protein